MMAAERINCTTTMVLLLFVLIFIMDTSTLVGPLLYFGQAFPVAYQRHHHHHHHRQTTASNAISFSNNYSPTALFGGGVESTNNKSNTNNDIDSGRLASAVAGGRSLSSPTFAVEVGDCIGSGSYGTVHFLQVTDDTMMDGEPMICIGKRPWTEQELREKVADTPTSISRSTVGSTNQEDSSTKKTKKKKKVVDFKDRAARCLHYWQVEEHCFSKLSAHPQVPPYYGTIRSSTSQDDDAKKNIPPHEWMVFGIVGESALSNNSNNNDPRMPKPALSLSDLMKLDHLEEQARNDGRDEGGEEEEGETHDFSKLLHLRNIGEALQCASDAETLDKALDSLLNVLAHVHSHQIVHRDIKPSNLLVHNGRLVLLDFGSAADLEPDTKAKNGGSSALAIFGGGTRYWGLEDKSRVAVSPIYCAPEIFVELNNAPLAFDLFSSALLFCQLLFGFLEERVDAGFHQQLQDVGYDLNAWLSNELGSKLRPDGLDRALEYLGGRPGLWTLLQNLLQKDPRDRPSAAMAQKRLAQILQDARRFQNDDEDYDKHATLEKLDGGFFAMVIESMEICELPTVSRPLHFVATFSRSKPLGLVFSEVDSEEKSGTDGRSDDPNFFLWSEATKDADPGEVFVKEIVPGGQADELGIFEVGDRLQGIGELAFTTNGFEKAVEMLQDQPPSATNVKLQFDRIRVRENQAIPMIPSAEAAITIADEGAWSTMGRRQTQEDAIVLHEIHDTKDRSILILGVMDGHGGTAASRKVSTELPGILSKQIIVNRSPLEEALMNSWNTICKSYQQQCLDDDQCVADYDALEGFLMANTGSDDLAAGTTASMMALDEKNGKLVALNCGDSRSMVVNPEGKVQLVTQDHTPETEEERLMQGVAAGLNYSLPHCRFSRWTIPAGAYEFAVGRSLEGPFVTSKGIVSDADISTTLIGQGEILVSATDGLWQVMDSDEIALDLYRMRRQLGLNARDAARSLCSKALQKGTSDNVSVVVVYT